MSILFSLVAVGALGLVAYVGVQSANLHTLFGVVIPYAAIATFLIGLVHRVVQWARVPVPFRVPATCGQQKSLSFLPHDKWDNPFDGKGVLVRMALEVLFFRSLFRNTRAGLKPGPRLVYGPTKWLWLAGLAFHWSFLVIFVRHFRFFAEPVPRVITWLGDLDGFFQIGVPVIFITDLVIVGALTYLFLRRVLIPQVKYISLASDYFPLFLLLGIALTGMYMRHLNKVDILGVKALATGLIALTPSAPTGVGWPFYVHFFLVCVLIAYFPFSKLTHMAGVFLSPTRNLANNNRAVRHVNPWNYPVKTHPYDEYEDEFRALMAETGYPLEKPLPKKTEEPAAAPAAPAAAPAAPAAAPAAPAKPEGKE